MAGPQGVATPEAGRLSNARILETSTLAVQLGCKDNTTLPAIAGSSKPFATRILDVGRDKDARPCI
jgi:hypothetical protein